MKPQDIQKLIDDSLELFKQKNLSFRSKIIGDTATDTYQLSNKQQGTGAFLPLTGGSLAEGANIVVGTGTGSKIATATNQKISFYGSTPIIQQTNTAGSVAAAGTYGANEQKMLQDSYSVLRNLGLLS